MRKVESDRFCMEIRPLTFVREYDVDVGDKMMFWMGMVPL